jgi:hypothetical protein
MADHHRNDYLDIDFRRHPERYRVGVGEQGVLMAEPYKSELLPHWRFRTPDIARELSEKLFEMFHVYLRQGDFLGADMARKFLQMGWTRAGRYANHRSGRKYDRETGEELPREVDEIKAGAAAIFYKTYVAARENPTYKAMKKVHVERYGRLMWDPDAT